MRIISSTVILRRKRVKFVRWMLCGCYLGFLGLFYIVLLTRFRLDCDIVLGVGKAATEFEVVSSHPRISYWGRTS